VPEFPLFGARNVLVLGSKEYPLGTSTDPIPSGGIEIYWERHAPVLRGQGVSLTVLTRRFPGVPHNENVGGIRVVRIPWIPGKLFRTPTFALFSAVWLLFHGREYDLIISNGPWATFFAVLTKPFHRRKVLFIPHGIAHTQPQYPAWSRFFHKIVEKTAYLLSDAVLFFTSGEADYYRSVLHAPEKKTYLVPPVVLVGPVPEEEKQRLRKELGVSGKKVIMFVGRLVKVKGVDILLRAFARLNRPDAVLVIVGDGPERENLEHFVTDLGISDRVIFTGWRNDASKLVSIADVFVLPSLSEGLPQSLLEALAHGVPCIVSDIPQLKGLPVTYFKRGDVQALLEKIGVALGDTE